MAANIYNIVDLLLSLFKSLVTDKIALGSYTRAAIYIGIGILSIDRKVSHPNLKTSALIL